MRSRVHKSDNNRLRNQQTARGPRRPDRSAYRGTQFDSKDRESPPDQPADTGAQRSVRRSVFGARRLAFGVRRSAMRATSTLILLQRRGPAREVLTQTFPKFQTNPDCDAKAPWFSRKLPRGIRLHHRETPSAKRRTPNANRLATARKCQTSGGKRG